MEAEHRHKYLLHSQVPSFETQSHVMDSTPIHQALRECLA
jgi:hypothetical protein